MDSLVRLPAPDRARTILALNGRASWSLDPGGYVVTAPYVEHCGVPLLLVDPSSAAILLVQARVSVTLRPSSLLGSLHLSGRPRPPLASETAGELQRYRRDHAECDRSCGARATVPVAVEVGEVALARPRERRFAALTLHDFWAGEPDPWAVTAHSVAQHMVAAHSDEILRLAAHATQVSPGDMLSATIAGITRESVVLTVVDHRGAADVHVDFARAMASGQDLLTELHRLLSEAAARGPD